jgi:very-short-patch-repair endonuclease
VSQGEEAFALHCKYEKLSPEREFRFAEPRRWRFDFAFLGQKLAVEIEGGTWTGGRHSRGSGMAADMEKYNTAVKLGWRVLRYDTKMVLDGTAINEVIEILAK